MSDSGQRKLTYSSQTERNADFFVFLFASLFLGFVVSYEILMKSSSQIYLTQTEMNKIHDR